MNFDLARQIVLNRYSAEELANAVDEDGLFCVSYGDQEDWVIEFAAKALGIRELGHETIGEGLYVCFGDRSAKIPLVNEGEGLDHELRMRQTLQTLNETLSPDYEIRMIDGKIDFGWYVPLDPASWTKLEQEFGRDTLDEAFLRLEFDASLGRGRKPVKTTPSGDPLQRLLEPAFTFDPQFAEKIGPLLKLYRTAGGIAPRPSAAGNESVAQPVDLQTQVSGVPILTVNGFKPVGKVVVGDELVAMKCEELKVGFRKVTRERNRGKQKIREIKLRLPDGTVEPVLFHVSLGFLQEGGSALAHSMERGAKILLHDGDFAVVESVEDKPGTVNTNDLYLRSSGDVREGPWAFCYGSPGVWVYTSR